MGGTGADGRTHTQPLTAPLGTFGPTTPKPDKSLTRANREKVGTPMPIWRDGGVDGWIVFGGPARAGPGGGGGGGARPGGGAGGWRGAPPPPPPGGGGAPPGGAGRPHAGGAARAAGA